MQTVACIPFQRHPLTHPGGICFTEPAKSQMHGFKHTCQAAEGVDGRQDLDGVHPLGATGLDPAAGFARDQEGPPTAAGRRMGEQPLSNIVHHGEVEARVGQCKAEGLFPVETAADGISRLAVGEPSMYYITMTNTKRQGVAATGRPGGE
jgi:hypothetical protein